MMMMMSGIREATRDSVAAGSSGNIGAATLRNGMVNGRVMILSGCRGERNGNKK